MPKKSDDDDLPVVELKKRAAKARTLLAEARALFPNARRVAKDDRRSSQGRLGADEATALRSVVDAMEAEPAIFSVLADEDEGHHPNKLETDLLRDRFDRQQLYAELSAEVADLASLLSDSALTVGALVKPITLAGYEIAKPLSKRHKVIREKIAPALDYYGANAAAAVAARRANKAAKEDDG